MPPCDVLESPISDFAIPKIFIVACSDTLDPINLMLSHAVPLSWMNVSHREHEIDNEYVEGVERACLHD